MLMMPPPPKLNERSPPAARKEGEVSRKDGGGDVYTSTQNGKLVT